ncbi:FimV/HubP family polar landmark protein [Pseudomonas sp. JUb42]|jgi:pilus assembly protein FimV|uniref:FimV/HubP family polar landmark protein n=1 Tax=Pseudomonas sp. JUb42 TaxID=2940611 RepID=UPI002169EA43|nr:FimV/HubP family polar landmark protein [Pseudomonas sp. JUb42]
MVQVRKLVLAIAAASALSSGMAHALGLGELSVKSTLNQPLVAEIELKDAGGLSAGQVVPSLATTADFAQAGIARQAFLNDLTFTPVINANGKSVLRITSSRAVREPYVKFLVQVLWPNGRLLREYSLLLDPPKFSPEAAAAAAATAQLPATAPTPAPAPAPVALPPAEPVAPAAGTNPPAPAAKPAADAKGTTQYTTGNNDTLWQIAEKVRNGGSVQQTMLAIQALNPDAFIAGNINRLKKGQVLRLPTPEQAAAMPQPKAVTEVAQQNRAWREGRRAPAAGARQVDATRREKAGAAPSKVEPKDNLSLVSANAKPAKGGKGVVGDKDIGNKLAVAQESLDTARRDNAELKSRMTDLQSQVDKLQRLIQLKNDQLAKMQAPEAAPATPAATPAVPATIVPANAAKPAETPAQPAAAAGDAAQVSAPEPDKSLLVEPVAPPPETMESSLNKLLANPVMMGLIGGGAVLLLLLLALFLIRRRKAREEADKHKRMARALAEESDFVSDMDMELPQASFDGLDVPPPSVKMAPSAAAAPAREVPADALVQAEIHIAYGRMNQAVELLEEAIKEDPDRTDVRMKLMEIYAEQGNTKAFAAHERKMVAAGKNHAEVEQLKSRYPTMNTVAATAAVAAASVTAAAIAAELDAKYVEELLQDDPEPEPPVVAAPVVAAPEPEPEPVADDAFDALDDNEFDLSLDGLDDEPTQTPVDLSLDDLLADEPSAPAAAEPSFESLLQQQTEAKAEADAMDDLSDFDLDLGEDAPELKAEDDFVLDDDALDLGIVDAEEPEIHDLQLPDDFDLSLSDDLETAQATEAFASEIDDVNAELDRLSANLEHPPIAKPFEAPSFTADDAMSMDDEPDFDFLSGTDEAATKLDLARAYIEMEDSDGARDILDEVVAEGNATQKAEAQEMLARLA